MKNKKIKYRIKRLGTRWIDSYDTLEEAKKAVKVYNLEWFNANKTDVIIEKVTTEQVWSS